MQRLSVLLSLVFCLYRATGSKKKRKTNLFENMTDEESKKAEAEKVDDDKPSEPGCCFHFGQCIFNAIK